MSEQIECKDVNCSLKGYWIEMAGGEKKLCFKASHNREIHIIKLDLNTVEKLLAKEFEQKA